jgi:hypothetical protein
MTTTVANTEQIANIAILLTQLHAYTQKRGWFIVDTLIRITSKMKPNNIMAGSIL